MKIELEFAELHTPLFLGGKNFGLKLMATPQTKIELIYDRAEKELWVNFNGKTAVIPTSNVVSMTPKGLAEVIPLDQNQVQTAPTGKHKKTQSAQVSSPTSHVFGEGPGAV
jgi:hypothetical protein